MRDHKRCNQREAAHRLGVTPGTVMRLVRAGALSADRVDGELCFDVRDVEEYAASRRCFGRT